MSLLTSVGGTGFRRLIPPTPIPVAGSFSVIVPESAVTAINVAERSTFVGAKSALTVTIVTQPAGGDSAAPNASKDVNYTAGAVAANTVRSFTYTITDANGTSAPGTVTVTVQNSTQAPPNNAVCFTAGQAADVTVGTLAALQNAIAAAAPGTVIAVSASITGGTCAINGQGTQAEPIIIQPTGALLSKTFTGVTFNWDAASTFVVFTGFAHSGGRHNFRGNKCRIDRCTWTNISADVIRVQGATNSRISRCEWTGYVNNTNDKSCLYWEPSFLSSNMNVLVDRCYFHDLNGITPTDPPSNRSYEVCRSFSTVEKFDLTNVVTYDHCLFKTVSVPDESELISLKYGGTTVQFCTIEDSSERVTFRNGNNNTVRSCWFEGTPVPIECYGNNHLIIGNNLGTGQARISCGDRAYPPAVLGGYHTTTDTRLIGNTGGTLRIGHFNGTGTKINTRRINYTGNTSTIDIVAGNNDNLTTNPDSEPFVAAVKLLPADVGTGVADDVCGV